MNMKHLETIDHRLIAQRAELVGLLISGGSAGQEDEWKWALAQSLWSGDPLLVEEEWGPHKPDTDGRHDHPLWVMRIRIVPFVNTLIVPPPFTQCPATSPLDASCSMTYPRDFDEFDSARLEDWVWLERVSAAGNWGDLGRGWVDEVKTRHAERILELTDVIKRDAEWLEMARRVGETSVAPSGLVAGVKQPPGADAADADPCGDHTGRSYEGLSRRTDHEAGQVRQMAAAMATLRKLVELTPTHRESAIFHPPLAVDGNLPTALAAAAQLLNVKSVSPCNGDTSDPTSARPPIPLDRQTHSTSTGTQYEDEPVSGSTSHVIIPAQHIPVGNVPDDVPGAALPTLVIPKVSLRTPDGQYVWNGHQRIMVDGVERAVCIDLAVSLRDLPLGSPYEEPESPPSERARPPEVEAPATERVHVEPTKERVHVEPAKERIHVVPAEIETPVTCMKRKLNGTAARENGKRVRIAS